MTLPRLLSRRIVSTPARRSPGVFLLFLLTASCVEVPYDVVIRGGWVVDGTGAEGRVADVGIRGDRIAEVGDLGDASALQVVEAEGWVVAPGFMDLLPRGGKDPVEGSVRKRLLRGTTTTLIQGDGRGSAAVQAQREALLERGMGGNVAQLVHWTPGEEGDFLPFLRDGMEAGAFGLSAGFGGGDRPSDELLELARTVAVYEGILSLEVDAGESRGEVSVEALEEAIRIARSSGVAAVLRPGSGWGAGMGDGYLELLEQGEAAWEEGTELWVVVDSPRGADPRGLRGIVHPRVVLSGGPAGKRLKEVWEGGTEDDLLLPSVIHALTGAPAQVLRVMDRGVLRPGAFADLVILDPGGLEPSQGREGSERLAGGVVHVLVNGEFAVQDGELTDLLPGRVLNRRGADFTRPGRGVEPP